VPLRPADAVPAPESATQAFRAEGLAAAAPDALSRAVLVVTECGDRLQIGRTVSIARTPFSIGRATFCDLAIADPGISRSHAVIERRDGAYWIVDGGELAHPSAVFRQATH
jgi:pSer/pThr/pTyr-binding forkhead associated (FHA) protein